ncbi:hypothetical protein YC2023_012860 [Brassica napus]
MTTLVSYAYPIFGREDVDVEPLVNPGREFDTLDVISPASQDYNIYMLEILPPKYKMYVETCMDKMEPIGKCGLYVIKEILTNEPVSREITFTPTIQHCSKAIIIGLCLRAKLKECLPLHYYVNYALSKKIDFFMDNSHK